MGIHKDTGRDKKLELKSISRNTVKKILRENGIDSLPKRGKDTWDDFIKRHFKTLWGCDFFTKTVWTTLGPKTFYALFFINIYIRKVHVAGITKHLTRKWVNKKAKTISFLFKTSSKSDKLLIRDGDGKYSKEFDQIINKYGVKVKKTLGGWGYRIRPSQSPEAYIYTCHSRESGNLNTFRDTICRDIYAPNEARTNGEQAKRVEPLQKCPNLLPVFTKRKEKSSKKEKKKTAAIF